MTQRYQGPPVASPSENNNGKTLMTTMDQAKGHDYGSEANIALYLDSSVTHHVTPHI